MKRFKAIAAVLAVCALALNMGILLAPDADAYLGPRYTGRKAPTYCYDANCGCNVECGTYCKCSGPGINCGPGCESVGIE